MKKYMIIAIAIILALSSCRNRQQGNGAVNYIEKKVVENVIDTLIGKYGESQKLRIEKGVNQVASLWRETDGTKDDFKKFCIENFIASPEELDKTFERLSRNYEILFGGFNKMYLELKAPLDVNTWEENSVDMLFGSYSPSSHLTEDFFENKTAFLVILNFPFYSLKEKSELGNSWTRKQWAYARMGDLYNSRVPAELIKKQSEVATKAEAYISEYNIFMGNLIDDNGKKYFPLDMKLLSHWNLRDELKSDYNDKANGLTKQKMIYEVMTRIITQEIPENVINSNEYIWNPAQNKLFKDNKEVNFKPEPDTRYQRLLDNFLVMKEIDKYNPQAPDYIKRHFEDGMEISQEEIEKLFIDFISSPQVKSVGKLISQRQGRKLEPFDIWYDGFKPRSSISGEELDKIVSEKYPSKDAFEKDIPDILMKLGFKPDKAQFIASKISVDPARGSGHAWPSEMKSDNAHLRTRIGEKGMNYKGYNIAIHELGHNVEQTITLQDIDYYMLRGVPNTAFTEAVAFIFQKRDLELLGIKDNDPLKEHYMALDNLWSAYEIMGVSLVDMNTWKWLYEHPDATAAQLKEAVINISKDVWNKYYADVFGVKDQPILAIYSHMINDPLYLSAYPVGHLIEFQIEKDLEGKNFADELQRILVNGSIVPQLWMEKAVGNKISIKPTLDAVDEALKFVK